MSSGKSLFQFFRIVLPQSSCTCKLTASVLVWLICFGRSLFYATALSHILFLFLSLSISVLRPYSLHLTTQNEIYCSFCTVDAGRYNDNSHFLGKRSWIEIKDLCGIVFPLSFLFWHWCRFLAQATNSDQLHVYMLYNAIKHKIIFNSHGFLIRNVQQPTFSSLEWE